MDPRLLIEGLATVAMLFAANWIRIISADMHELVAKVQDHGERIAVLEDRAGIQRPRK